MKSFNQELKSALVAEIRKHREQDQVIQGSYGEGSTGKFRGCAVGCTIHSLSDMTGTFLYTDDHSVYEKEFGIPAILSELQDVIHEGLYDESFPTWPERFMGAVPTETDLSLVFPKFALWFLTDEVVGILGHTEDPKQQDVVKKAAGLFSAILADEKVPLHVWKDGAYFARSRRVVALPEDECSPARAVSHLLSVVNSSSGNERRYLSIVLDVAENLGMERYVATGYYEKCAEKLTELLKAEGNE